MEEITLAKLEEREANLEVRTKRIAAREAVLEKTTTQLRTLFEEFFGDVVIVERYVLENLDTEFQNARDYIETARDEIASAQSSVNDAYNNADEAYDNIDDALSTLKDLL
jgi:chromosome segregation ATPase